MDIIRIIDLNDKYALITEYGYILHTEKRYDDMISYCQEQFAGYCESKRIITDFSQPLYDVDRTQYITIRMLEKTYNCTYGRDYQKFKKWIREKIRKGELRIVS